jgi:hypothetical protein
VLLDKSENEIYQDIALLQEQDDEEADAGREKELLYTDPLKEEKQKNKARSWGFR